MNFAVTNSRKYFYTADRWRIYGGGEGSVVKVENGLRLTGQYPIEQTLERKKGLPYTMSAKINNQIYILNFIAGVSKENERLAYRINVDRVVIKCFDTITIVGVKLEQDSITSSFVYRTYAEEVLLCRQYYRKRILGITVDHNYGNNKCSCRGCFELMKSVPSLTILEVRGFKSIGKVNNVGVSNGTFSATAKFTEAQEPAITFRAGVEYVKCFRK